MQPRARPPTAVLAASLAAAALGALACGSRTELLPAGTEQAPEPPEPPLPPEPPEPPEPLCTKNTLSYVGELATVVLLIDQSGSMLAPFGDGTRWSVMSRALFEAEVGLVAVLDGQVNLGVALYTSFDGFSGGTCPVLSGNELELADVDKLRDWFLEQEPAAQGDTPTGESLAEIVEVLSTVSGPRYIIVLTDGQPDTCAVPDPQQGGPNAEQAAGRAFSAGVKVFPVSVGDEVDPRHLQRFANAGQGAPVNAVYPDDPRAVQPLVASDDPTLLASQLKGVLPDERNCTVRLPANVESIVELELLLDGETLTGDDYALEGREVHLLGEACDHVLGEARELRVEVCTPP